MADTAFDKLDQRQKLFVVEYARHGNATKAAIAAGYERQSATNQGWRLKINEDVLAALVDANENAGITERELAHNLRGVAFDLDLADYQPLFEGMTLPDLRKQGVDTRNIKKIKVTRRLQGKGKDSYDVEDVTLELHDRLAGMDRLAKLLGLIIEKRETKSTHDLNVTIKDSDLDQLCTAFEEHVAPKPAGERAVSSEAPDPPGQG